MKIMDLKKKTARNGSTLLDHVIKNNKSGHCLGKKITVTTVKGNNGLPRPDRKKFRALSLITSNVAHLQ